jgi:hypothetical protein
MWALGMNPERKNIGSFNPRGQLYNFTNNIVPIYNPRGYLKKLTSGTFSQ